MAWLTVEQLHDILRKEMDWYAGLSDDSKAFFIEDISRKQYVVTGIMNEPGPNHSYIIVQARIVDGYVVVDEDTVWDKNLWKALVAAGVPREQIVLAYQGESVPMTSEA